MWVIKLGGSLLDYSGLEKWLEMIAASPLPIVIVPGGGPLADAVRYAQKQYQFKDDVGHHLGLLAMEKTAEYFASLNNLLEPCRNFQSIQQSLMMDKVPVWMPAQTILTNDSIKRDWTMTSDSLSVWLASSIQADGLLLVKSCSLNNQTNTPCQLSYDGVVDQSFPRMVTDIDYPVFVIQRDKYQQLDTVFAGDHSEGLRLEL